MEWKGLGLEVGLVRLESGGGGRGRGRKVEVSEIDLPRCLVE